MSKKISRLIFFILMVLVLGTGIFIGFDKRKQLTTEAINGLMMLIEFEDVVGVLQWEKELDARGLTALVKVQNNIIEENPEVFKRLAEKGYEIAGGYDSAPFWDMPYDEQYQYLQEAQDLVETTTGKKMRVFGSRYFAYDENTLRAADALGIEYILARGTQDVAAVIYAPEEYEVKVISVTNVENGDMGRGSLCDYSLWARGAGATEFAQILAESLEKKPENMILVSHAYLGGTRLEWWEEYRQVLSSEKIVWRTFDHWLAKQDALNLPNAEIPVNREVKYVQPQPEKAMKDYVPVSGLEVDENEIVVFHNGQGPMCLEALDFFTENGLEYREYLTTNAEGRELLLEYQAKYSTSSGESSTFGYLPIIFYQGQAYSGFNDQVAASLL